MYHCFILYRLSYQAASVVTSRRRTPNLAPHLPPVENSSTSYRTINPIAKTKPRYLSHGNDG